MDRFRYRLDNFINEYRMYHPEDPKSDGYLGRAAWAYVKTLDPTARQIGKKPSKFQRCPFTFEIEISAEALLALYTLAKNGIYDQTRNGITRPMLAGPCIEIWEYLDKNPGISLEHLLAYAEIRKIAEFKVTREYYRWLQFNGIMKLDPKIEASSKRHPSMKAALETLKWAL